MYNIRVRFSRGENVRFISHLDMMKTFERTLRRGGLPVAYSKGFNPHPQMVFGLPLSVGVTSDAEYADFEMAEGTDPEVFKPEDFATRMNEFLPTGISIKEAGQRVTAGNIMASIAGADYEAELYIKGSLPVEEVDDLLKSFMARKDIVVKKEGKGGIRDVDIKPMIRRISVKPLQQKAEAYHEFDTALLLEAALNAGSVSNLKPELLISAIKEYTGLPVAASRIHRKALYVEKSGVLTEPLAEAAL